jgi:hypothetical protein
MNEGTMRATTLRLLGSAIGIALLLGLLGAGRAWGCPTYDEGTTPPTATVKASRNQLDWSTGTINVGRGDTVYFKGTTSGGGALPDHDWDTINGTNTDQGANTFIAQWNFKDPDSWGSPVDINSDDNNHVFNTAGTYTVLMRTDDSGTIYNDAYTSAGSITVIVWGDFTITLTITDPAIPQNTTTTATCTANLKMDGVNQSGKTITFTAQNGNGKFSNGQTTMTAVTDANGNAIVTIHSAYNREGLNSGSVTHGSDTVKAEFNKPQGGTASDSKGITFWDMWLTAPENDKWYEKGVSITISASDSDTADMQNMAFYAGGTLISQGSSLSTQWDTSSATPGNWNISATATDIYGKSLSDSHAIILADLTLTVSPDMLPQDHSQTEICTATLQAGTQSGSKTITFSTQSGNGEFTIDHTNWYSTVDETTDSSGHATAHIRSTDNRDGGADDNVKVEFSMPTGGTLSDNKDIAFWDMWLTAPADNSTIQIGEGKPLYYGDDITLSAEVSHTEVIQKVAFYVSQNQQTWTQVGQDDTTSPYSVAWESVGLASGTWYVKATATDENNKTLSDIHTVTIDIIPLYELTILEPDGGTIGGKTPIRVRTKTVRTTLTHLLVKQHENTTAHTWDWVNVFNDTPPTPESSETDPNTGIATKIYLVNWTTTSGHNGSHTIYAEGLFNIPGGTDTHSDTKSTTVKNLAIISCDPHDVLTWDGDTSTTVPLTVNIEDNDLSDPVEVNVFLYPVDTLTYYQPIRHLVSSGNTSSTIVLHWDGKDDNGAYVPIGVYTYEVEVRQLDVNDNENPPLTVQDSISYRGFLTISDVTLAGGSIDALPAIYVNTSYNLQNLITGNPGQSCLVHVWAWVRDSQNTPAYWANIKEYTMDPSLGTHNDDVPLVRGAIASVEGSLVFVVSALDTDGPSYRDHRPRWGMDDGKEMYNKILDVTHYDQPCDDPNTEWDEGLIPWCGEAGAQMWLGYKGLNVEGNFQAQVATWVLGQFGENGWTEELNGIPGIQACERGLWAYEYAAVLNHYLDVNKYSCAVSANPDLLIGQEASLIAGMHEPSAAKCEMDDPGQPNNPSDDMWHWTLVVGCAANANPVMGGVTIFGLWIQEPGGWFSDQPAYVSSDIWKGKYFEPSGDYGTGGVGIYGYIDVRDPPPGSDMLDRLKPVKCQPPTRPHGRPDTLAQVKSIADEGISLHLLAIGSPLGECLRGASAGIPVFVHCSDLEFGDYYLIPYLRKGKVTAAVIVDAETGQFHGASACTADISSIPVIDEGTAVESAKKRFKAGVKRAEFVWQFSREMQTPYEPMWKVELNDGKSVYVSHKGSVIEKLTPRGFSRKRNAR